MIESVSKKISNIITDTVSLKMKWTRMDNFKDYLKERELSLKDIPYLHSYLETLQSNRFIFDCESTYISVSNDDMIIFSQSKFSHEFRLDVLNLHEIEKCWKTLRTNLYVFLRLRNAILFTDDSLNYSKQLMQHLSLNNFA